MEFSDRAFTVSAYVDFFLMTFFVFIGIDVFKHDPDYEENEEKYQSVKREILGEECDEDDDNADDDESDESGSEEEEKGI